MWEARKPWTLEIRTLWPGKSGSGGHRPLGEIQSGEWFLIGIYGTSHRSAFEAWSLKFERSDVDAHLTAKGGKETNIRVLIASLDSILWAELGWQKVGMHELVSNAQVKSRYTRAIAWLHLDKVSFRCNHFLFLLGQIPLYAPFVIQRLLTKFTKANRIPCSWTREIRPLNKEWLPTGSSVLWTRRGMRFSSNT